MITSACGYCGTPIEGRTKKQKKVMIPNVCTKCEPEWREDNGKGNGQADPEPMGFLSWLAVIVFLVGVALAIL